MKQLLTIILTLAIFTANADFKTKPIDNRCKGHVQGRQCFNKKTKGHDLCKLHTKLFFITNFIFNK